MMFPRVPPQSTDPWSDIYAQIDQAAAARQAQSHQAFGELLNSLTGMLGAVDQQPGPQMMAAPPTTNPLGAMAAIFASTLGEQMGARGASGAVREQLAGQEAAVSAVNQRNIEAVDQDRRERQMQRLDIMTKIAEAKAQHMKEQGDIDGYYKQLKLTNTLEMQQEKLKQTHEEKMQRIRGAQAMAEIGAKEAADKVPTPKDLTEAEERELRMFQTSVEASQKLPGNLEVGKEGPLWSRKEVIKFTPKGKADIRNKAYNRALTTQFPKVRQAAMMAYFDTLVEPDGTVSPETLAGPDWAKFLRLGQSLPDDEATSLFEQTVGTVKMPEK